MRLVAGSTQGEGLSEVEEHLWHAKFEVEAIVLRHAV